VALFGIGAYVTAIGSVDFQLSVIKLILLSGVFASVSASLIVFTAGRLKEEYFAVATLAFHFVIQSVFINFRSVTKGVMGISGIESPFDSPLGMFLFIAIISSFCLLILWYVFKSRLVLTLRGLADSEIVAGSLGVDPRNVRLKAFLVSGFFCGIAGSLFAFYLKYIDPSSFALSEIMLLVTIVLIGRSFFGVIVASFLIVLLPEAIRFLDFIQNYPNLLGSLRQLIYSVVLFLAVHFMKEKILQRTV
jgi:branched-chain amino acid transport system permease protein